MENNNQTNTTNINWYPGHMAKTKRLIKENLNVIDIIYEVIDARIPYSSRIIDIEDIIKTKPRIMIMTKYDLCDKEETDKFIKYYESLGFHIVKYDLTTNVNFNTLYELSNEILKEKLEKNRLKGLKDKNIRALVIGVPNAGKSTLINKIVGKKIAVTGNKPGVTKNLNWVRAGKNIELLDSPGILWPKFEEETTAFNLASTTAIKEEILPKEEVAYYILNHLQKYYPNILKEQYDLEDVSDYEETIETIGKKKGCMKKGGIIDEDKVINIIINDIKSGKIKGITFDRSTEIEKRRNS